MFVQRKGQRRIANPQVSQEGTEAKQSFVLLLVDKWHGGIALPHHHR